MPRKALGRGLSSLLGEVDGPTTGLEQVPVGLIDPNPFQPRREFSEESLKELVESIRTSGVVQPVLLRRANGRFQIVAGERRWRAARAAGLDSVPAVVRVVSDEETVELALTENLQREDLNPMEVARAYETLQEKFHFSHEDIANRLGFNRTTVTNTLRLLRLDPEVQEMLRKSRITFGHAKVLLALESPAAQVRLAEEIVKQGLSVRQAEELVADQLGKPASGKQESKPIPIDPNIRAAVLELERTLGTKVRIVGNDRRGKIEIRYFSGDDLNRLYEWITRKQASAP